MAAFELQPFTLTSGSKEEVLTVSLWRDGYAPAHYIKVCLKYKVFRSSGTYIYVSTQHFNITAHVSFVWVV